jgi:uncharacterized protein (TIGR03382 family)
VKLVAYTRDSSGAWSYWDQGPAIADNGNYHLAQWITPAVPAGSLGLSVGVTLGSRGALTMDQVSLEDLGVDAGDSCATAPSGSGSWPPLGGLVLAAIGRRRRGRRGTPVARS